LNPLDGIGAAELAQRVARHAEFDFPFVVRNGRRVTARLGNKHGRGGSQSCRFQKIAARFELDRHRFLLSIAFAWANVFKTAKLFRAKQLKAPKQFIRIKESSHFLRFTNHVFYDDKTEAKSQVPS
jgi:hypothetical protein